MQSADRGMCVPGTVRAVLREYVAQRVGVVGEVLEGNCTILNETHGFTVPLETHHDVETGLADFPQILLCCRIRHLDDTARQSQVSHEGGQVAELREQS